MASPFVYDRYVTGKNFIGRKKECGVLGNLLAAGEHVVMYEPPKAGKNVAGAAGSPRYEDIREAVRDLQCRYVQHQDCPGFSP